MRSDSAVDHTLIDFYVVLRHASRRKTLLEYAPAASAIEMADSLKGLDRLLDVIDDITADLIVEDFGHRAAPKSHGRRTASHGFDHDQSKRFRPIDREKQCVGISQKLAFAGVIDLAEHNHYIAQLTSVPGVAQRTGATIYYLEIYPRAGIVDPAHEPVLALMPVPGDVDIVIASELMEAGRAIQRGLITPDRTTLIASTNRVFSMTEKVALADGRVDAEIGRASCRERVL